MPHETDDLATQGILVDAFTARPLTTIRPSTITLSTPRPASV
jgi:hypothetical protein